MAFALNNLANAQSSLERYETARATRAQALAIAEESLGASHPAVASIRLNQGFDLARLRRFSESLAMITEARRVLERAVSAFEDRGDLPGHLAQARFRLARALGRGGPDEARAIHLAERAAVVFRDLKMPETAKVGEWLASATSPSRRVASSPSP